MTPRARPAPAPRLQGLKTELAVVQRKMYAAESELQARPPVDFSALAENIAMAGGAAADGRLGGQVTDLGPPGTPALRESRHANPSPWAAPSHRY